VRYLRLYLQFIRFSLSRAMEFRLDFFFRVAMDVLFYAVSLAFFSVLYGHTPAVGGWSLPQIYVFVCGYLLVDALYMTVFSNNLWWLPILINRGDLDYYLVRPVSSLFFLSLRDFAANSLLNVALAAGLVAWSLVRYPGALPAGTVLAYLVFLALGTVMLYLVRLAFILPVFWLQSSHGLLEVSWSLTHLGERPVQIYRGWLRLALLTVLPMAFIATVPAEVLFTGLTPARLAHTAAVVGGFAVLTGAFWRRALASYSSASS
jgi:ABC-2 type transport system permease protein